jgi:hypothetical protein
MVDKVTERVFSRIELMRSVASSFDNNVVVAGTGDEALISGGISISTWEEKARLLSGMCVNLSSSMLSSSDILEQQNIQLRKENLILRDTLRRIEERLTAIEAYLPSEKIIVLREITREEAEKEIRGLFCKGEILYYSDIAERLRLDLQLVVEICNELQSRGEIEVVDDAIQAR